MAAVGERGACVILCVCVCVWLVGWFRRVGGGRLDGLLTQSPHTPVAGCTTTFGHHTGSVRILVLTDSSHTFVARISVADEGNHGQADRQTALPVNVITVSLRHCLQCWLLS